MGRNGAVMLTFTVQVSSRPSTTIQTPTLENAYTSLFEYCRARNFVGHDPFDGLGSPIFRFIPFGRTKIARLGFQQVVKRSAFDLRPVLKIKPGENAKATALFTLAEISRLRATADGSHRENAFELLGRLDAQAIRDGETMAFGYNFDWQSRAFFAAKGTPTIVPTAFAARAYLEAYEAFGDKRFLDNLKGICRFITTGLERPVDTADELCFSYTPQDRSVIYNASLLSAETLAAVGTVTGNAEYLDLAKRAAGFVVGRQKSDGSWKYGDDAKFGWIDNFHTAYVLESLYRIDAEAYSGAIRRGFDYWLDVFFESNGAPRYFHNRTHPLDIHSAAVAIATLAKMADFDERAVPLAEKVAAWTLANMCDPDGFFYYQIRESGVVKTPFIRWSQAWMAYALGGLLERQA